MKTLLRSALLALMVVGATASVLPNKGKVAHVPTNPMPNCIPGSPGGLCSTR